MATTKRDRRMAEYTELMTGSAIDAHLSANHPHRYHLTIALRFLASATDEWWEANGTHWGDEMSAAIRQTYTIAGCDDSCGASPRNRI